MDGGDFAGVLSLQVVLSALAAWIGKIWADRIARKEQARLNERIRHIEASLEAATHVTKAQYDREFEIYRDLWEKMLTATGVLLSAPAIKAMALPEHADHRPKQVEILRKAVGEFGATVQQNRPFYADEVYQATEPIAQIASEAWLKYELGIDADEYFRWAFGISQHMIALRDHVMSAIRHRMKKISTV